MIQKKKLRISEIDKKISDIIDTIEIVRDNIPSIFNDFINMGLAKDGIYKKMEFAIESVIDICNILNSDLRLGVPNTEDDLLNHLEGKKIFTDKVIKTIRRIKGFRNILVHKYGDIDDKRAFYDISKGIEDFEIIIGEIEKFLETYKLKNKKIKKK